MQITTTLYTLESGVEQEGMNAVGSIEPISVKPPFAFKLRSVICR